MNSISRAGQESKGPDCARSLTPQRVVWEGRAGPLPVFLLADGAVYIWVLFLSLAKPPGENEKF